MAKRKQRSDKGQPRATAERTWARPAPAIAPVTTSVTARGKQASDGPTTGYRDGVDGVVEKRAFADGWIPEGWHDSPADCDNCDGESHAEYVKV